VMIVVDMSQPWTIMESLERWAEVVRKHIQTLQIPDKQLKAMQENLVKQFQSYVDPEESSGPVGTEEEGVALPLGKTTLICNIGIPIIVVCCKSDAVVDLEKTHGYTDEHLDFIQQAIRSFCLNYGAALFYVSSKEEKNVAVLHKYLVHRAYGMPFKEAAWVVDKDAVFIPSGWDNEKKISILYEHMKQFKRDQDYSGVIMTPKTTEFESEIGQQSAEEDQVFLMAMQAHMVRSPRPTAQQPSTGQTPTSRHSPRPSGDAGDPSQTSGVLANFFNSLLSNKKQPGGRGSSSMRAAATAELDRLQSKS